MNKLTPFNENKTPAAAAHKKSLLRLGYQDGVVQLSATLRAGQPASAYSFSLPELPSLLSLGKQKTYRVTNLANEHIDMQVAQHLNKNNFLLSFNYRGSEYHLLINTDAAGNMTGLSLQYLNAGADSWQQANKLHIKQPAVNTVVTPAVATSQQKTALSLWYENGSVRLTTSQGITEEPGNIAFHRSAFALSELPSLLSGQQQTYQVTNLMGEHIDVNVAWRTREQAFLLFNYENRQYGLKINMDAAGNMQKLDLREKIADNHWHKQATLDMKWVQPVTRKSVSGIDVDGDGTVTGAKIHDYNASRYNKFNLKWQDKTLQIRDNETSEVYLLSLAEKQYEQAVTLSSVTGRHELQIENLRWHPEESVSVDDPHLFGKFRFSANNVWHYVDIHAGDNTFTAKLYNDLFPSKKISLTRWSYEAMSQATTEVFTAASTNQKTAAALQLAEIMAASPESREQNPVVAATHTAGMQKPVAALMSMPLTT